jgi:tetratricopeptide (TPR) repeat protein
VCDARGVRCHRVPARSRTRRFCAGLVVAALLALNTSCTAQPLHVTAPSSGDREATLHLARQAALRGDLESARERYEGLVERNALDDEARAGLARVHAWSGEYERAERLYREVLSRHAKDDDVRAGLFNVLVWDHRWDEAARLLNEAPRRDTPVVLALRARLVHADGNVTKARALIEKAEQLAPTDLDIRALRQRMFVRSARVTSRALVFANGSPALGQVDLSLSQSIHRLRLTFDTEQGARPTSLSGSWTYGATYGGGAWWTFAPGWSFGAEAAFGAPARAVPVIRVRSQFTAAVRPWLSSSLGYSFRRFADAIDTHGLSPSVGLVLRGELRLDATYWLTHVKMQDSSNEGSSRWVQAIGLSAGRTLLPWLDLRAGYAHGAEAERLPAVFQLLNLVNDSFYVGARMMPFAFVSIEPLYGLALRGPRGGTR